MLTRIPQERSFLDSLLMWHKEGIIVVHFMPPKPGGKHKRSRADMTNGMFKAFPG
jgi:hypothetical protein